MKKILFTIIGLAMASPAWSAQTAVTEISGIQPSVGALKTQVNTKLGTVESNRQDHETRVAAMETGKAAKPHINASAPADTSLDWYDTDQEVGVYVHKKHNGTTWVRVGSHGVQYLSSCASIAAGMCVDTDDGKLYYHNGTAVVEVGTGGSGATAINDLTDVDTTGKATGKILKFDASGNLVVGDDSTGSGSVPSGTVNGQVLLWATDQWAASTPPWVTTASLGTGVGTALAAAVDGTGGLASKASLDALPNIVFGTGIAVAENTPSAGTDTVSIDADTTPTDGSAKPITSNAVFDALAGKQATLVSGTNIKTVNNTSLLGSGNITITGGTGGGLTSTLSSAPYSDVACTADGVYNHTLYKCIDNGSGTGYFTEYVATTAYLNTTPVDTTPDAFTFADVTNATLSTEYTALAPINGITAGITCSGSGGTVAACTGSTVGTCGTFGATSGSITNGQYVGAKVTSSANASTAANNVVTCGGVSDTFTATTGGSSTEILYPTGVGTYNEYPTVVGSTYCWSAVDESTYDDADNCQSDDGYDKQTFAWQNTSASSGHTITKVRFYARISNTAVLYVNNTGLDWFIPTTVGTFETKYLDYTTKPGGGAWTSADIDNIDAGFMANNNGAWVSQVYIEVFYE